MPPAWVAEKIAGLVVEVKPPTHPLPENDRLLKPAGMTSVTVTGWFSAAPIGSAWTLTSYVTF